MRISRLTVLRLREEMYAAQGERKRAEGKEGEVLLRLLNGGDARRRDAGVISGNGHFQAN